MRRLLFLSLCLAACDVEPKSYPTILLDAGPAADASVDSGVLTCVQGGPACGDGQYCKLPDNDHPQGSCADRPHLCTTAVDCEGGEGCTILGTPSSASTSTCAAMDWACGADADCPSTQRCTDLGRCAAKAERFLVIDEAPVLVALCTGPADCGPGGRCVGGECARCTTNADCGDLRCDQGRCVEQTTCTTPSTCFAGNTCVAGSCRRSTSTCTTDPENDFSSGGVTLLEARYPSLSICGDDVDWYRVIQKVNQGLTIIVRSPDFTPQLRLQTETIGAIDATTLTLPGFVAIRVPASDEATADSPRTVYLEVSSADRSGSYELELVRESPRQSFEPPRRDGLCASDPLDLYGDDLPARALAGPTNVTLVRRHCAGQSDLISVDVGAQDQLRLAIPSGTDLDLGFLDENGVELPSTDSIVAPWAITSSERFAAPQKVHVRTDAAQGPSAGLVYPLELGRRLGSRVTACRDVEDLSLSGGQVAISGTLAAASDLGRPSCGLVAGCSTSEDVCRLYAARESGDVVYRLTATSSPSILRATVRPTDPRSEVALAVLQDCNEDGVLGCNRAPLPGRETTVELRLTTLAPIAIMISSDQVAAGFELEVQLEAIAPPSNDACANAEPLLASGTQLVSTYGAANDDHLGTGSLVCAPPPDGQGKDRFYRLDVRGSERAAVELTGAAGGFLWAGRSCLLMTRTCTSAAALDVSTPVARAVFEPAEDTTYFIAVDGAEAGDEGSYQLRTIREPELECLEDRDCTRPLRCDDYRCVPVPANDNCPGTRVDLLTDVVRIQGSTGAANDQLSLTCIPGGSPEVVYRVAVPPNLSEVVFRIVDARFDPAIGVRFAECGNSLDEACNDDVRRPDVLLPEVRLADPVEGDYFVIVDAYAGQGPFTLEIESIQ